MRMRLSPGSSKGGGGKRLVGVAREREGEGRLGEEESEGEGKDGEARSSR